jgi:hypothetical protein
VNGPACCHGCPDHVCPWFIGDKHLQLAHDLKGYRDGSPVWLGWRYEDEWGVADTIFTTTAEIKEAACFCLGWASGVGSMDKLGLWITTLPPAGVK